MEIEYYKNQKAHFTEEYEKAHERYPKTTSHRNKEAKKRAWEEFSRFGAQLIMTEEAVKRKNQGILPGGWK